MNKSQLRYIYVINVESSGKCKISKSFGRTQFSVLKNLIFSSVSH